MELIWHKSKPERKTGFLEKETKREKSDTKHQKTKENKQLLSHLTLCHFHRVVVNHLNKADNKLCQKKQTQKCGRLTKRRHYFVFGLKERAILSIKTHLVKPHPNRLHISQETRKTTNQKCNWERSVKRDWINCTKTIKIPQKRGHKRDE